MTSQLTPLLKPKVDELFLHWFSEISIQQQFREELSKISNSPKTTIKSTGSSSPPNSATIGLNVNTRPSSPPIPPISPTSTPRSPRRPLSSESSRRGSRKSLRQSLHEEKHGSLFPGCAKGIKQFYFPFGEPQKEDDCNKVIKTIRYIFEGFQNNQASFQDFSTLMKVCGYPLYWKYPLFSACGGTPNSYVSCSKFVTTWKRIQTSYHDDATRFYHMLVKNKQGLQQEDFQGLLQDIIDTHPGLQFLLEAPEFHSRYIRTVIARIFYSVNRSWSGYISLQELRRSNLMAALTRLEEEDDINQIMEFFSYEHFYVIYCKFWELDSDHDLKISKIDMLKYSNNAISSKMIERLFDGCVTRKGSIVNGKMCYDDFVWFILSEVDKTTPTGIEYWFRCMDLNGDGMISLYEMEYFYDDQLMKMQDLGMETLAFQDCICQMFDLVKPASNTYITLRDIKKCKLAPIFYDTFFNLDKWLEHEQKDPFLGNKNGPDMESIWERYAAEEYELLVAEEGEGRDGGEAEVNESHENIFLNSSQLSGDEEFAPRWSVVSNLEDNDDLF